MKKGKYPLYTEPLYEMVPRMEYEFMKNAVAELAKTKKELEKANKIIKELKEHENERKKR